MVLVLYIVTLSTLIGMLVVLRRWFFKKRLIQIKNSLLKSKLTRVILISMLLYLCTVSAYKLYLETYNSDVSYMQEVLEGYDKNVYNQFYGIYMNELYSMCFPNLDCENIETLLWLDVALECLVHVSEIVLVGSLLLYLLKRWSTCLVTKDSHYNVYTFSGYIKSLFRS